MPGYIMNQNGIHHPAAVVRGGQDGVRPISNGEAVAARVDSQGTSDKLGALPVNGISSSVAAQIDKLPPEIQHIAVHYEDFSKLLFRTAQECFVGLHEVLMSMSEKPVSNQPNGPLTNGIGNYPATNGTGNSTEHNVEKKLMLMKFAEDQRARFIKLLVISDWARNSPQIVKLIDIFLWAKEQDFFLNHIVDQFPMMRGYLQALGEPNPDIRTALEALSTGKGSWMPDMGCIPPKPFTPQQALQLLRRLDAIASLRLNLHEDLPRYLKNWKVKSGRATFVMPQEFELDLITHTEDTSMPWLFTDIRFLFSPSPHLEMDTKIFEELTRALNTELAVHGLNSCFLFVHSFVLTHKITVLKAQAYRLLGSSWVEALRVETPRRSLVVQYWIERPGKKSWIEITVASGKSRNGAVAWKGEGLPHLAVRWFREGVWVRDEDFDFDWTALSMERMLKKVIARHVHHILGSTQKQLTPYMGPQARMSAQVLLSEDEPSQCALSVSLGDRENKITVTINPVTGRYCIRPCNPSSSQLENALNNAGERPRDFGIRLLTMLGASLQAGIHRQAQQVGWRPPRHALRADSIKSAFKVEVLRYSTFRPQGWPPEWALAAVIDPTGGSWWIVRLSSNGKAIEWAEVITQDLMQMQSCSTNRASLQKVERLAAQWIALRVTTRFLVARSIPYRIERTISTNLSSRTGRSEDVGVGWTLRIPAASLVPKSLEDKGPWAQSELQVTFQGCKGCEDAVWYIVKGASDQIMDPDLRTLMSATPNKEYSFPADGGFAFLLSAPFGTPIAEPLSKRLEDLDRMRWVCMVLRRRNIAILRPSLEKVTFRYASGHVGDITFGPDANISLQLSSTDPHNRILQHLNAILNPGSSNSTNAAIEKFTAAMVFTLPLLRGLDDIETRRGGDLLNPAIHPRAIGSFRLSYMKPLCAFDISLKFKNSTSFWVIEGPLRKAVDPKGQSQEPARSDKLQATLKELYKAKGDHWFGVRTGIVAKAMGIEQALRKVHDAVKGCATEDTKAVTSAVGPLVGAASSDRQVTQSRPRQVNNQVKAYDVIQID